MKIIKAIEIDRNAAPSIAEQISAQLLRAIFSGRLAAGEKLPAERALAEHLGVSRGTVKQAYERLAQTGVLDARQGSGSYVRADSAALEENRKREAAQLVSAAFERLQEMGLSSREIANLMNLRCLNAAGGGLCRINIMVVSNNHDILSDLERQLSYLTESSPFLFRLAFLTLDTIAGSPDPAQLLLEYDKIIATSIDYRDMVSLAPMLQGRMIEARLAPRTSTLARLSELPTGSRVTVVYRTDVFRNMAVHCLLAIGLAKENIFCVQEREYNPLSHSDSGVAAVINFNESPVYTNPAFLARNEEFEAEGGKILRFDYQIERGALLRIEDQLQRLLSERMKAC